MTIAMQGHLGEVHYLKAVFFVRFDGVEIHVKRVSHVVLVAGVLRSQPDDAIAVHHAHGQSVHSFGSE
jgi:hypothetical protein